MDANLDYPKHLNYSDFEPKQFLEFLLENPEDLTTITSLSPGIIYYRVTSNLLTMMII